MLKLLTLVEAVGCRIIYVLLASQLRNETSQATHLDLETFLYSRGFSVCKLFHEFSRND